MATEKEEPEQKPDKRTGREGAKTSFIDWFRSSKKEEKRVPVGSLLYGKKNIQSRKNGVLNPRRMKTCYKTRKNRVRIPDQLIRGSVIVLEEFDVYNLLLHGTFPAYFSTTILLFE